MREKVIPSSWLDNSGRRLDCGPYLSGAIEARVALKSLSAPKMPLLTLVRDGEQGIFHAGREGRTWVEDRKYGVPFLSSSDVLSVDFDHLPLIAKKQVASTPEFVVHRGWILITRSGTIGRMVYCRPDMDGFACSEHVMRVIPDIDKVPAGFLFAFLAGRYGLPLVVGGTYGAIIQHIEPDHLYDVPVPRLGEAFEAEIHSLIQCAADKRSEARSKLLSANQALYDALRLTPGEELGNSLEFSSFRVKSDSLTRLDAHFYSPAGVQASLELSGCCKSVKRLDEVARVFTPGIFKRIHVSDPQYGYPYFSGSELFDLVPQPRGLLSKKSANIDEYVVKKDWLLIQDAGQLGGLIGQITRVRPGANGSVVSNHLMRVVCHDRSDTPYVYLILNSRHGHLAILRHAFGTSIPQLDPAQVRAGVSIPWLDSSDRARLGVEVEETWKLTDEADALEADAINKVEAVIAEGV